MMYRRRMSWALFFAALLVFSFSIIAWGTCTTPWHSPNNDDPHDGFSWDNGAGGRIAYDGERAYTTTNGEEHEFDEYGFTLGDIPASAVIVGFEVRIRGYSVGGGSVSVGLSPDGGSTIDLQTETMPWIVSLPQGSTNEAWNSVYIDNPPFIHTFTPAEVCANSFTVWVKANVFETAVYVDSVQVCVVYYDEIIFPWNPYNPPSVSSTTHSTGVWYNANTLPPEGTTVTLGWNSATDRPTCDSGIDGYRTYWDASSSTNLGASDGYFVDEDGAHTQDFTLGNGQYWFHIRSVDNVENLADSTAHYGPYQYDDTWPTNPNVTTSRATGAWLNSADVPITVSGASDTPSGVDGFETAWTHAATWTHTSTKNREENWTGETFTLPNDGVWYFHLATVDNAANWVSTLVYETEGWFGVDTHVPTDPTVTSSTHAEGSVSSNPNVQIAVSGATDPVHGESGYENSSGVDGFSVAWDGTAVSPPDAAKDHEQDWTGTTYALEDGTWYFHLRTKDNAGNWTSTEDYGPVTIDTSPPNAPSITGIADDNGSSGTDEITNDNTLIISGTAEANSTVEVFRDSASIGTTPADESGNWAFDYTGVSLSDGSYSFTATATDVAGNASAASSALPVLIDTQAPPTPGGRAPADGTYTNDNTPTFSWSEPTDPGSSGVRDYHIIVYDSTHTAVKNSYPSSTQYTPTALADGTYTWKLATRDVAGNTGTWGDEWTLVVDTLDPTCTVSVGTATIYDSDLVQEVTIDYSEEMTHTSNTPTIEFTGTTGIWSSNGNGSWDANYDRWTESFTITDAEEDVTATVKASGAEDLAGNTQVSNQTTFAVDTLNPTVTNLYLSSSPDTTITDWDVADVTQDGLYVHFSEPMTNDGSADPVFTFDPVITHTLPNGDNSLWDPSSPDTVYGYFTAAQDGNVDVDSVDVNVTGARDEHGNLLVPYSEAAVFDIDTLNPTITSITSTTPDGYYASGSINVTVSFSELVTLTGGTLDVTLDTPDDVVGLAAFGPSTSSFTTYTVGAGDNSCDLDAIDVVLNGGTLQDNVGNDAVVGLPGTTIAAGSDITVDTTDPVIGTISITAGDNWLDVNCEKMVNYSVTITDNCCIDLDASPITVTPSATNATVSDLTMTLTPNTGKVTSVNVSGTFIVSVTDACSSIPSVQIDVADCTGNTATRTDAGPTLSDVISPTFLNFTVTPTDGLVDDDCEEIVNFSVNVHDNCCIDLDDPMAIVVIESATNATTSELTWNANETGLQTNFTITGSFTVEDLTGCPAIPTIEVQVTDLCGNTGIAEQNGGNIEDEIIPVINELMFNTDNTYAAQQLLPYLVDKCGLVVVYFSANVTDNCCIVPGNVTVTVTLPTNDAILEDIVFDRVQNGQGRVDITGNAVVRCLESCPPGICPSRVQVDIVATDCCGNAAIPDTTGILEGLVGDIILPIPRDDPRQDMRMDESAVIDPLVEVRLDEFGTYRLVLRESTPVRIDIMANDADNSSHNEAHPFAPCIQCGPCGGQTGCCGIMYIHEIVEHPSYGTVTIEDDEGNCAGGTVIRYAPIHGYLGPDYFTYRTRDAFGNVSSVIATVYLEVVRQTVMDDIYLTTCVDTPVSFDVKTTDLWVNPDNPDEIPFVFSIFTPPMHGVVSGDLGDVTYEVHGATTKEIESATITLVYTPATGFNGHDALTLRFADPFGGSSTAVVDIAVIECAGQPGEMAPFVVPQGEIFPLIVPLTFAVVYEKEWETVTVQALNATGTLYNEVLSATWEESIGRYVLRLDTASLPPGLYQMVVPLGNGETVTLMIEVGEAV